MMTFALARGRGLKHSIAGVNARMAVRPRAGAWIETPVPQQARGFRRFSMRGLAKVQAEWALVCATHNILKVYRLCYG